MYILLGILGNVLSQIAPCYTELCLYHGILPFEPRVVPLIQHYNIVLYSYAKCVGDTINRDMML